PADPRNPRRRAHGSCHEGRRGTGHGRRLLRIHSQADRSREVRRPDLGLSPGPGAVHPGGQQPMTGSNQLILIVDDDPRNVRLLEGIFRGAGYRVSKAYDGAEALRRAREEQPDLVLLDVMMPQVSGHEVCAQLKSDPRTRPVPIIMVTALNSVE